MKNPKVGDRVKDKRSGVVGSVAAMEPTLYNGKPTLMCKVTLDEYYDGYSIYWTECNHLVKLIKKKAPTYYVYRPDLVLLSEPIDEEALEHSDYVAVRLIK